MRTIAVRESDAQEEFYRRGWTDGLPIVPPTPERVSGFCAAIQEEADTIIGRVPERSIAVTVEMAAVSAAMAGCRPDYFPVVIAAVKALLSPEFNAHVAITSTSGVGLFVVVSGPVANAIGMNSSRNALGTGARANATIGRSLRLLSICYLGAKSAFDGTSIGSPAKYSYCIAEADPPTAWEPLRIELGFAHSDSTVTLFGAEAPRQVANFTARSGKEVLNSILAAMTCPATNGVQKGCQVAVILGPEHASALTSSGWSREDAKSYLANKSRLAPEVFEAAGIDLEVDAPKRQGPMAIGADGLLPTVASSDDIFLVTAGGPGPGWSSVIQTWIPKPHIQGVTRLVK